MNKLDLRLFVHYDNTLLGRGFTLAQQGKVEIIESEESTISAEVTGSEKYSVVVGLSGKEPISYSCTCPYHEDMCKHVVAVLVAFDGI